MEYQKREIKNLIMRIVDLSFRLNSVPTKKETTGDRPTVFVYFCGHTAGIDVRIYPRGWELCSHVYETYSCFLNSDWDSPDALYNAVERLEELYDEWGDFDENEDDEGGKHHE